ncbi:hypothetical protein [Kamptonema formosum]|uniref:hypothetical protein n=1 Tax=Kamptonema formosum TaxID=331992 RepID=UPI0003493CE0|nr:hypothetical protein [Oscillatoria sp. PCC 10802]
MYSKNQTVSYLRAPERNRRGAQECGELLGSLETERETGVAGLVVTAGAQKTAELF